MEPDSKSEKELSLHLDDLQVEEIVPVELNEEAKGHPENLASTVFNCTDASGVVVMDS